MRNGIETHRLSQVAKLRRILSDKRAHRNVALVRAVGWRFGAALEWIRNGWDGRSAWRVECIPAKKSNAIYFYRMTGPEPRPRKKPEPGATWKGRALKAERALRRLQQTELFRGRR